jgi:hypothetical protein
MVNRAAPSACGISAEALGRGKRKQLGKRITGDYCAEYANEGHDGF